MSPESRTPDSKYLFVEVAAQRCLQLMRGARPKVEGSARKYTTLAVNEVEAGEIPWELGDAEPSETEAAAAGSDEDEEE